MYTLCGTTKAIYHLIGPSQCFQFLVEMLIILSREVQLDALHQCLGSETMLIKFLAREVDRDRPASYDLNGPHNKRILAPSMMLYYLCN